MYLTFIIIGITVLVSFYAWKDQKVMGAFIMNPYAVGQRKQYYRFISSGLIHQDHMHLIFNMLSLYFFGIAVEHVFAAAFGNMGQIYFLILYVGAIIVSDIPTYLKHKGNPRYNSLGASGGVAAIIFAFIIFRPLDNIYIYFALPVPGFILGTLYIIYSWYQGKKSNDNINHDAHLYGALFGLVFCMVMYPAAIGNFFEQIRNWDVLKKFL